MEPTGPAWLSIAVFVTARCHVVHRVSSAKAFDPRRLLPRPTRPTTSTPTPWPGSRWSAPAGLQPLRLPEAGQDALDRRVRPPTD